MESVRSFSISFPAMQRVFVTYFVFFNAIALQAQDISQFITSDQFGYLPDGPKVAVIRSPQTGYDSEESFLPGQTYALVDAVSGDQVFSAEITRWNGGAEDATSGDRTWWFDFSSFEEQGAYYILDTSRDVRSHAFWISRGVYNEVLRQAVRTFFYQRAGFPKKAEYAGSAWSDGASHLGPLQDAQCRLFSAPGDADTERDLHGGWYDAGDYNKYTSWTANYVVEMMKAYLERPAVWTDDYNLPESGNGIPDILDEARWGLDHLMRLQEPHGGVLCIVDLSHASPPSSASGQSLYGPATTSATLNTASAFALSSRVHRMIGEEAYADTLQMRALHAWEWAEGNPDVLFRNNDPAYNSLGIGAGQQEEDEYRRGMSKLEAACFLFDITGEATFRDYFDAHYNEAHLMQWNFAYPFETDVQETLLHYAMLDDATAEVANDITAVYRNAMNNGNENFPAQTSERDPYRAHIKDYTWGSNATKCSKANMFLDIVSYSVQPSRNSDAMRAALGYVHYLHGVNPLGMVYLSNMYGFGADNAVNEFYHTWFTNGSALWDRVGESVYGPAPGYLTGGPNPSYNWDGCCPDNCGSANNNARCHAEPITPPLGQPSQKSYKDFNTSWPLNSWSVTENSCGYQVRYIRMLSKYAYPAYDCSGEEGGSAFIDVCGNCSGGNTGITPISDSSECAVVSSTATTHQQQPNFQVSPNPSRGLLYIHTRMKESYQVKVLAPLGMLCYQGNCAGKSQIDLGHLEPGHYFVLLRAPSATTIQKVIIVSK
jgi:endoglucanase